MSATLIQTKIRQEYASASTNFTTTFDSATTAGNTLIGSFGSDGTEASAVTDSAGNTWTKVASTLDLGATGQRRGQLWYCLNADPVTEVHITSSTGQNILAIISEWQGVTGFRGYDAANTQSGATTTAVQAGDLVYGPCYYYRSTSGNYLPVDSGWQSTGQIARGANHHSTAYRTAPVTGQDGPLWDIGAAGKATITAAFITNSSASEPAKTLWSWSGDGLSAGSLTTGSAGDGDAPFTNVTGAITIENSGPRAPRIRIPDAAQVKRVHWWPLPEGPHSSYATRLYVSYGSIPAVGTDTHIMTVLGAGVNYWTVRVTGAGMLRIRDEAGGTVLWTATDPIPSGRQVRIETIVDNGQARLRAFLGDSRSVLAESPVVTVGGPVDELRFGLYTATATDSMYFDDLAVADSAEWIGPAVESQSNSYVRVDGEWRMAEPYLRIDGSWVPSSSGGGTNPDPGDGTPAGWAVMYDSTFDSNDGWTARQETQSNDNSYNTPANVLYGAGGMTVLGKREDLGNRPYTSGDVLGQHIAVPNYFRAEVTATLPTEPGMWPCPLWFRPLNGTDGEIDVCETWPYDWGSDPKAHVTIWENYDTKRKENAGLSYSALPNSDPAAPHTYTVEKTYRRIRFEIDGVLVYEWNQSNFNPTLASWYDSIYEVPGRTWYPRVTLQIGAGNAGTSNNNAEPDASWEESELVIHSLKIYEQA